MLFENHLDDYIINRKENFDFIPHIHHNMEILVCTNGRFCTVCNGVTFNMEPGDLMIAFSNQVHSYRRTGVGNGILMIVNPWIFPLLTDKLENRTYDNFLKGNGTFYADIAEAILKEYHNNKSKEIIIGYLYVLLGNALNELHSVPLKTELAPDTISKILIYLSESFRSNISLKSLSDRFKVDPCHISRMFKQKTGCKYLYYLHQLRINYAQELLCNTDRKITDIAYESGFSDIKTFNRVFSEFTGFTPSVYRSKHRV